MGQDSIRCILKIGNLPAFDNNVKAGVSRPLYDLLVLIMSASLQNESIKWSLSRFNLEDYWRVSG